MLVLSSRFPFLIPPIPYCLFLGPSHGGAVSRWRPCASGLPPVGSDAQGSFLGGAVRFFPTQGIFSCFGPVLPGFAGYFTGNLVRWFRAWEGPVTGPPLPLATRSRGRRKVQRALCAHLAPGRRSPLPRATPCGVAILQHRLYTASALAVDGPPPRWLRGGSRGDSLRGLVHTSPIRHRERPGEASVATASVYVHPAAAVGRQGRPKKKAAVG